MNSAELRTTREAVGLSVPQLARLAVVQERTVRYWETGHTKVPADVASLVNTIDCELNGGVELALQGVKNRIAVERGRLPTDIVLLRYRDDSDFWRFRVDMKGMPASCHAMMLHRTRAALADLHIQTRIVYMVPDEYDAWLGTRADSPELRAGWASLQVLT